MANRKRTKKNIKEDQLVTHALRVSEWVRAHFNQVIIGLVVLVGLITVLVFSANSRQTAGREAERALGRALTQFHQSDFQSAKASFQQIGERYGGRSGAVAGFFAAECELRQGNFSAALTSYQSYIKNSGDFPAFVESATYGSALCHAGLEDYAQAANTLVGLLGELDEDDPRYLDTAFQAGEFFATAGENTQAANYFQEVVDKAGPGELRNRADVAVTLING